MIGTRIGDVIGQISRWFSHRSKDQEEENSLRGPLMVGQFSTWQFQCSYCSTSLNYTGHLWTERATRLICPVCQSLLEVWLSPSLTYLEQYDVTVRVVRMGPSQQVAPALVGGILGALVAGGVGAILGAFIGALLRRHDEEDPTR